MEAKKIAAILLIVIVALGFCAGGVSQTYQSDVGSLRITFGQKQYINVPELAGIVSIVLAGLLLVGGKKPWPRRPDNQNSR